MMSYFLIKNKTSKKLLSIAEITEEKISKYSENNSL